MKKFILYTTFFTLVLLPFVQDSRAQNTLEGHTNAVESVAFSHDGTMLASGSRDGTVVLWNATTRQTTDTFEGHTDVVSAMAYAPDGTLLASGSSVDGTVKLWNVQAGTNIAILEDQTDVVSSIAFTSDGILLASGFVNGTILLWDIATKNATTLEGHRNAVSSVAFSQDGTLLASGSANGTILLWDVATGTNIATFEEHTNDVSSVAFSQDGTLLASGSDDNTVKLWDVQAGTNITTLEEHTDAVSSVAFSQDGTVLSSGSVDGMVILWNVAKREQIISLEGDKNAVSSVAFSPNGTLLASGSANGSIWLWNVSEWTQPRPDILRIISGDDQQGTPRALLANPMIVEVRDQNDNPLPDVQVIFRVTAGAGKLSGRFTIEYATTDADGRAEATLTSGPNPGTNTVEVSIAGPEPVTFHAMSIGTPTVPNLDGDYPTWHVPDGAIARLGKGPIGTGDKAVAFSPNGQNLAVASGIGVWLYDVATSRELMLLPSASAVNSVAFSRDGMQLTSGSVDGTVALWDIATGNATTFEARRGKISPVAFSQKETLTASKSVESVAFSPDGKFIASGRKDGTVVLLDIANGNATTT